MKKDATPTQDPMDPRLQNHWRLSPLKKLSAARNPNSIAIVSYPDDEGIRLNGGRPGADRGPQAILKYLGRHVYRFEQTPEIVVLEDQAKSKSLASRHEWAEENAKIIFDRGYRLVTLGGGHDYGYPDAAAYYEKFHGKILNIDAHLDVRPVQKAKLNSGTPFFRFIERFGGKDLVAWGIQKHCNAVAHRTYSEKHGAQIFDEKTFRPRIPGSVGLSICLDAFQGIRGVSAPAMVGLDPRQGVDAVQIFSPKSAWLGLYESAPSYDPLSEDSARFAALLAYHFIHSERIL